MFLSYLPQNPVDSDKIWYTLSWINLPYSSLNVFHLNNVATLPCETANPKTHPMFTMSTKPGRFWWNFVLVVLNVFATEYYKCFAPHLSNASALPCETYNSCFCENSDTGKAKLKKFYILTLILLIEKEATFWLWHHVMANLIRKICTKHYQNRPRFVKDMTKTF